MSWFPAAIQWSTFCGCEASYVKERVNCGECVEVKSGVIENIVAVNLTGVKPCLSKRKLIMVNAIYEEVCGGGFVRF